MFRDSLVFFTESKSLSSIGRAFKTKSKTELAVRLVEGAASARLAVPENLSEAQYRVLQVFTNEGLSGLALRETKRLPLLFWGGDRPLIEQPNLISSYLQELRRAGKTSWFNILARVYFDNFGDASKTMESIRFSLQEYSVVPNWKWSEPAQKYGLFASGSVSPASVTVFEHSVPAIRSLEAMGFKNGLEASAYARELFRMCLKKVDLSNRVYDDWIWKYGVYEDEFRFPECKAEFVNALLKPWLTKQPPEERRTQLTERLTDLLGDPRINLGSWLGVEDDCIALMRRWLTRDSIELFLDVVGESAVDHQWSYRRAFWMSYLDKNYISDAWVAFGPTPKKDAMRVFRKSYNSGSGFGELIRPRDRAHSVLLMRIGDVTIAEFSHNGKCWVWPSSDKKAPQLYKQSYHDDEVRDAKEWVIHSSSPHYTWQNNLARIIHKHTGVKTSQPDWRP